MTEDEKQARRLMSKAATIRRNYEARSMKTGGDSAQMNIPFRRARTKRLHAEMTAASKMAEAIRMESEAARLLGRPDPHAPAARAEKAPAEIAASSLAEADDLDAEARLMEEANIGFGALLYLDTAKMRRRAYVLRVKAYERQGRPNDLEPVPIYESDAWTADRLDKEADVHDQDGNAALAASKRSAAAELRRNGRPPIRTKDGTERHVLYD